MFGAQVSGEVYVGVLVSCSLVKSGGRPFKYLAPAVDWVLTNFPGNMCTTPQARA